MLQDGREEHRSAARKVVIHRQSRVRAHFDQLRRTAEPHDAHVRAPVYSDDQRLFKEIENSEAAVALHYMHCNFSDSSDVARHASDRSWSSSNVSTRLSP